MRDPEKLWDVVSHRPPHYGLKEYLDEHVPNYNIPLYPQDELLSTVTQREYLEELQQAAKEGDKYAAERLTELT